MSNVHVKGLRELEAFLRQVPPKMEANIMRGALRAGAKVIADQAKSNVPVKTGTLRESIRHGADLVDSKVVGYVRAGSRGKAGSKRAAAAAAKKGRVYRSAFYVHWIEYGTAAHEISVKTGKRGLFFGGVVRKRVHHPGIRPKPFLRPALDSRATAAVVAAAEYMKRRLSSKHGLDTSGVEIEAE